MRISVGMGKFADQVPVISKPAEWPTPLYGAVGGGQQDYGARAPAGRPRFRAYRCLTRRRRKGV
jgi:hypothetical protein